MAVIKVVINVPLECRKSIGVHVFIPELSVAGDVTCFNHAGHAYSPLVSYFFVQAQSLYIHINKVFSENNNQSLLIKLLKAIIFPMFIQQYFKTINIVYINDMLC